MSDRVKSKKVFKSAPSRVKGKTENSPTLSKKVFKSAPSKLNGEKRRPIIDRLMENTDLKGLFTTALKNEGVISQDIALVSKKMSKLELEKYSFIANSSKFKEAFLSDMSKIRKNENDTDMRTTIIRFCDSLFLFMFSARPAFQGYVWHNNRLNDIISNSTNIFISNLERFRTTFKYSYLLNICNTFKNLAITLVEYSQLEHIRYTPETNNYTLPYVDKYLILAYEYNKFCLIYYLYSGSKNKTILNEVLKNILTLQGFYRQGVYPKLSPSNVTNIENDTICLNFLVFYFKNIPKTLTEHEYNILRLLKKQTVFSINLQYYETFKQDTKHHSYLYDKCIEFITKKEGLMYEISNTPRFSNLVLNVLGDPPIS